MANKKNTASYLEMSQQNSLPGGMVFIRMLEFLQYLLSSWPFHVCILLALSVILFCRTLTSYFIADDFGEILYVSQISAGRWDMFWSNFTGNYMQVPGMAVYRPWLLITLLGDFLLWKGNAFGYYLTNLLYFCLDVLLVYLAARVLSNEWKRWEAGFASLCAAALFAANPLHCESISWVVGRVDPACCFYYLLSFLSFAYYHASKHKLSLIAGTVLFCLALTTKEMAIGLPAVVFAYAFFQADKAYRKPGEFRFNRLISWKEKLIIAWRTSWLLWLVTLLYFLIRFLALGTFTGGYQGSIGAGQLANIMSKWTDLDTVKRLFFPFAYDLFQHKPYFFYATLSSYAALGFLLLIRALSLGLNFPLLAFLIIWILTTLAPICHLWGLGYNLEGGRFCFFLTVPLSMMVPLLLLAPATEQGKFSSTSFAGSPSALFRLLRNLAFIPLLALVTILAKAAYTTNLLWVHAGKEVRHLCLESEILAGELGKHQKAIVLGLPKRRSGAHMILNGITYDMMLGPPFLSRSYRDKFLTFEPVLFGHDELINPSRFKAELNNPETAGTWLWDSSSHKFKKLQFDYSLPPASPPSESLPATTLTAAAPLAKAELPVAESLPAAEPASKFNPQTCLPATSGHAVAAMKQDTLEFNNIKEGDGLRWTTLNLNPLEVDYLIVHLESALNLAGQTITAYGNDIGQPKSGLLADKQGDGASQKLTLIREADTGSKYKYAAFIPLSRYWRWYTEGSVRSLFLGLPAVETLSVNNLVLADAQSIAPALEVLSHKCDNRGVIALQEKNSKIDFQTTCPPGNLESFTIQISHTNFFFSNQADSATSSLAREFPVPANGHFSIQAKDLGNAGYYEIRLAMTRPDGLILYSDTVIVNLDQN